MSVMERKLALGAVIAVAVVGAVAALVFLRRDPEPAPAIEIDGLPVITVSAAIDLRQHLGETDPLAVFGWFSYGPPHSCSAPNGPVGELELRCHRGEMVLAEFQESGVEVQQGPNGDLVGARTRRLDGRSLDPYIVPFSLPLGPLHPAGVPPWKPLRVVAVGHFRDHRAVDCAPDAVDFCLQVFVVDHFAMAGGNQLGPVLLDDDSRGVTSSDANAIATTVVDHLGPGSTILAVANMVWTDISQYERRAAAPIDARTVWLVRAVDHGRDGAGPPTLRALVIDDITGDVLWESEASRTN
jgi:hypothetical protein